MLQNVKSAPEVSALFYYPVLLCEYCAGYVPIGNFVDLFDEVIHVLENHTVPGEREPYHPYVIGESTW